MSPTKVLKDLSVNLYITLPPSNTQTRFTIQVKKDQILIDAVRRFMNEYNIPCYLESPVLSTIESLMNESWRRDVERDSKIQDESDAAKIRENIVAKYKKYTMRYNDSPAENIFPKAYHTLVHSPVPSIFDTLLQLEQSYKQAIKDLVFSREKELEGIRERHRKEMEVTESNQNNGIVNLVEKQREDVEYNQVALASELEDIKRSQRREYCEFVIKLYQAHQRCLTGNQSAADPNWIFQLDGKEIVSEVINDMKDRDLSKQILRLVQKSGTRSRHGSISSLSEVMLSPTLMSPTSPFPPSNEDNKKPAYFNEEDPQILKRMEEIGFNQEQAKVALEMTNGNMQHAVNILLEQPDKINNQIANTLVALPRRPSTPFVSSPLKEQSGSIGKRSKSQRKPGLVIPIKQEKKNSWSAFFQPKHQVLASPNASSARKFGWLGRKNLEEDGNGHGPNLQLDNPQLVESFTISLGNQVKSTHNLRLDTEDLLNSSNDARDMAYRAQTAANLYSQNLTAIVLLLTPRDWPKYKLGKSANKAFFEKCKESTDFHFEDVESQFDAIERNFTTSDSMTYSVQEGDFFITRHSNLPLVHVVFHLVIEFESIQKSELTHKSNAINGLRNILRTIDRFDITSISLPILLLPLNINIFTTDQIDENALIKRGELVLKCAKGSMMKNSRVPNHMTEKEQETKTITFLLNKDVSEQQFNGFRQLLTGMFRAS